MSTISRRLAANALRGDESIVPDRTTARRSLVMPFAIGAALAVVVLAVQVPWSSSGSRLPSEPRIVAIETAPLEPTTSALETSSAVVDHRLDWDPPPPPADEPTAPPPGAPEFPTKRALAIGNPCANGSVPRPSSKRGEVAKPRVDAAARAPSPPAAKESPRNVYEDRT